MSVKQFGGIGGGSEVIGCIFLICCGRELMLKGLHVLNRVAGSERSEEVMASYHRIVGLA